MLKLVGDFLGYMAVERGASTNTTSAYRRDLKVYVAFLEGRGVTGPDAITRDDVTAYVAHLQALGLAPASVERKVASVKSFHKFLVRDGVTDNHPTASLPLPKKPSRLPDVVSIDDVERLLEQRFPDGPVGYRDRAILEVLYGCGMRASELTGLDLTDLDLADGSVRVFGKGGKERLVPIAGAALEAVREYLAHGRPVPQAEVGQPPAGPGRGVHQRARGKTRAADGLRDSAQVRGARRARVAPPHAAALVRDAHARGGRGPARAAGDAGALGHHHHAGLHTRRHHAHARGVPFHAPARQDAVAGSVPALRFSAPNVRNWE